MTCFHVFWRISLASGANKLTIFDPIGRCSLADLTGRQRIVSGISRVDHNLVANYGLESLKDYFSQFGEVMECTVMRDGATGRSRGFGFLTFKDPKTVNIVMVKEHYLDGKIVRSFQEIFSLNVNS